MSMSVAMSVVSLSYQRVECTKYVVQLRLWVNHERRKDARVSQAREEGAWCRRAGSVPCHLAYR